MMRIGYRMLLTKRKKIFYSLLCLAILPVCACGFKQPSPSVQYYVLNYASPEPIEAPPLPVTIRVKHFRARPPYDFQRIVYAENEFQRTTYVYHQWLSAPADMLTGLFARDFRAAGIADAVVTDEPENGTAYVVDGIIEDFYENDAPADWQAILSLSLTLRRTGKDGVPRILFQKTYRQAETMEKNNPLSLARAMGRAMKSVSTDFIKGAYQQIASDLP